MDFSLINTFAGLGILTSIVTVWIIIGAFSPFLRPSKLDRYLETPDGKPAWALVTGASDGIGKALSHKLASRGFNVVLHGRNPAKLQLVQQEMQATHPDRNFRTIVADATRFTHETLQDITSQIADLNITVLISNAGVGISDFRLLEQVSAQETDDLIRLNTTFPTLLIHALLPTLTRRPSVVIIIGSLADYGFPLISTYGPAKAYLRVFAKALAREARIAHPDLEVMYYPVGSVTGVSHTWTEASFMRPDSSRLARDALARVGCGRTVVSPYWPHQLSELFLTWLPGSIMDVVTVDQMVKLQAEGLNRGVEKKNR